MDSLALFCNLHADGTETLERLRLAGFDHLEILPTASPSELEELLELSPDAVRSLIDEARSLVERLTGLPFDPSQRTAERQIPVEASAAPRVSLDTAEQRDEVPGEEIDCEGDQDAEVSFAPSEPREPLAGVVLEAWRELDVSRPLPMSHHGVLQPQAPPLGHAPEPVAGRAPAPERQPLGPAPDWGLDAGMCARLADVGLTSFEELTDCDVVTLSRAAGIPYTRLARTVFLVRRSVEASSGSIPVGPARGAAPASSESGPAPDAEGTDSDEVAGPFA